MWSWESLCLWCYSSLLRWSLPYMRCLLQGLYSTFEAWVNEACKRNCTRYTKNHARNLHLYSSCLLIPTTTTLHRRNYPYREFEVATKITPVQSSSWHCNGKGWDFRGEGTIIVRSSQDCAALQINFVRSRHLYRLFDISDREYYGSRRYWNLT